MNPYSFLIVNFPNLCAIFFQVFGLCLLLSAPLSQFDAGNEDHNEHIDPDVDNN
jgi:hypothetical protein